jgi:uncharacterized protein (DUF736 family)
MTPTAQSATLEQIIAHNGDRMYQIALLLAGTEREAAGLLQQTVQQVSHQAPAQPELPALLATMATTQRERQKRRRAPKLPAGTAAPFAALFALPVEQRLLLGYHLLFGDDLSRVAPVAGLNDEQARGAFIAAVEQISRELNQALPDEQPTDDCDAARRSLMQTSDRRGRDRALRGHLAVCSACRAFEDAWDNLLRQVESSLRSMLRDRVLSAELRAKLLQAARPPRPWQEQPALRFAMVPLAVLVLIALLILPGFWNNEPAPIVETVEPVDPARLVEQALDQVAMPPEGSNVWHAEWETLWYFNNERYAPVRVSAWIDQRNPARHRLQITHVEGGAAYELQIGDGEEQLWYALDPNYARSLSAGLVGDNTSQPQLITARATPESLNEAREARMRSGAWHTGAAYLRQAMNADDLRTLGRQRIDEKTVQIISFAGYSPFSLPEGLPDAADIDVTILLAIEITGNAEGEPQYGRLRRVTELVGPPGGAQTSRVTWRLHNEEILRGTVSVEPVFDVDTAWTGRGTFPERPEQELTPLQPLIAASTATHPARLFIGPSDASYWLPKNAPAGIDQALMRWWPTAGTPIFERNRPHSVSYYGQDRRLTIYLEGTQNPDPGERIADELSVGPWKARMYALRGQRYLVELSAPLYVLREQNYGPEDGDILIDARGFSYAEIMAVVEALAPFYLDNLADQAHLFEQPSRIDAEADALLKRAIATMGAPQDAELFYRREQSYVRQNPAPGLLSDPYHRPGYLGLPERNTIEFWRLSEEPALFWQMTGPDRNMTLQQYVGPEQSWFYEAYGNTLRLGSASSAVLLPEIALSDGEREALEMLAARSGSIRMAGNDAGAPMLRWVAPIALRNQYLNQLNDDFAGWPHLADLQPTHITSELQFDEADRPAVLKVYAGTADKPGTLIREWQLLDQTQLPLTEAPAKLRSGETPEALFIESYSASPRSLVEQLQQITLEEARRRLDTPLLIAPDEGPLMLDRIVAGTTDEMVASNFSRDWTELVARGLAVQFTYYDQDERSLQLYQGPQEPVRAFLTTRAAPIWSVSEPRNLTIAGEERAAWLMRSPDRNTAWLIVEIEGTTLIAEGQSDWLIEQALPLMADFRLLD